MTKHEADDVRRRLKAAGFTDITRRENGRGDWVVDGTEPKTGHSVTVSNAAWFAEWAAKNLNGATPTPGARLKYPELGATAQHSVTLPESCWQDIEQLGVNPKGKNVRSEGVFKLWQAWKAQEGEA
jgi:hypothetical protein